MATKKIKYIAMEDRLNVVEGFPPQWRVEALNTDTGGIYIAIFDGPGAQLRAVEYAAFKNGVLPAVSASASSVVELEKPPKTLLITTVNNGDMVLYLDSVIWSYDKRRKHVRAVSKHGIQPIVDNPRSLGA